MTAAKKQPDPFAQPLPAPGVPIPVVPLSVLKKRAGGLELSPSGLITLVEYCIHLASTESPKAGKAAATAVLAALKKNPALPLILLERPKTKDMLEHLAAQVVFWNTLVLGQKKKKKRG